MTSTADWPADLQRARSDRTVAAWLAGEGIDVVHVGIYDSSGTRREKRLPAATAATIMERGWSFIDAIQYWDPADGVFTDDGATHEPAEVDLTSGRPYPFEAAAASFVADFTGASNKRSPRVQLQRMIERAADLGLTAQVGWEFETIVLHQELQPADIENRCWSAFTPAVEAEMLEFVQHFSAARSAEDAACRRFVPPQERQRYLHQV